MSEHRNLGDLYEPFIKLLNYKQGCVKEEVHEWLVAQGPEYEISVGGVSQWMAKFKKAGVIRNQPRKVPRINGEGVVVGGNNVAVYFANNAVCFEPGPMAQAIGVERANRILVAHGREEIRYAVKPPPPPLPVQQPPANQPQLQVEQHPSPWTEPQSWTEEYTLRHQQLEVRMSTSPPGQRMQDQPMRPTEAKPDALPSMLFGAQFTRDGVLITYEQFHRVVALLQFATEES